MAILRGNCHSTVKRANLFIKPYDFVECTPDFSIKFGSMVTKLSFFLCLLNLLIYLYINQFKTITYYLVAKIRIFHISKQNQRKKSKNVSQKRTLQLIEL